MTGLERNADVVRMASYAPLFAHVDGWQWTPDLIWVDNLRVLRTPNYYVQQLFSRNRGDVVLPVSSDAPVKEIAPAGRIGLGTRRASAEFKDVRVTSGTETLLLLQLRDGQRRLVRRRDVVGRRAAPTGSPTRRRAARSRQAMPAGGTTRSRSRRSKLGGAGRPRRHRLRRRRRRARGVDPGREGQHAARDRDAVRATEPARRRDGRPARDRALVRRRRSCCAAARWTASSTASSSSPPRCCRGRPCRSTPRPRGTRRRGDHPEGRQPRRRAAPTSPSSSTA